MSKIVAPKMIELMDVPKQLFMLYLEIEVVLAAPRASTVDPLPNKQWSE